MGTQPKWMTWTGWAITGLVGATLAFSAGMKFMNPPDMAQEFVGKFGYPAELTLPIGILEITCAVIYLIPRTSVLGAVLLTGYLGGATATHVRVEDPFFAPVIVGALVWLGLYLRDPRIRALLPLRSPLSPAAEDSSRSRPRL